MGVYFASSSLFVKAKGMIHRGKISVQSNLLKPYQNIKTSIVTLKAQLQYLKHNHK